MEASAFHLPGSLLREYLPPGAARRDLWPAPIPFDCEGQPPASSRRRARWGREKRARIWANA
eukprot:3696273-Lingulodinium_polyedra.AAC.1